MTQRTAEQIVSSIKEIFANYDKAFPEDKGFADSDIQTLMKRTKALRRSQFLDDSVKALNLSEEEIKAWEEYHDKENEEKAETTFYALVKAGEVNKAVYVINNMKSIWSVEKRKELAKVVNEKYDINPFSGLVDTVHSIKKQTKAYNKLKEQETKAE